MTTQHRTKTYLTLAAVAMIGLITTSANADLFTWTGAGANSDLLNAADNWAGGLVPPESSGNKLAVTAADAAV